MQKVLIAGGSGLIGSHLLLYLTKHNYLVTILSKNYNLTKIHNNFIHWDELNFNNIKQFNIIINLCGFNISNKRWTSKIKKKIVNSRIHATNELIRLIKNNNIWLINASAIGFYVFSNNLQNEFYKEPLSSKNHGFSQEMVHQWENVVNNSNIKKKTILRFGVVLSSKQGIIPKMLFSVKIGLGAQLSNGKQYITWIHIDDLCRAIILLLKKDKVYKVVNIVSPNPCKQIEFITIFCKILNKMQLLRLPKFIVILLFGKMGKEILLNSHYIEPKILKSLNFKFLYPNIEAALLNILKK